jgi:hypothetical protein
VGIPGLTPGKGFEILRPNQGFYKSLADQPYAELRVILRYSSLLGMYTFDYHHQHHSQNHFKNLDPDLIFFNVDFSLRRTLSKIINADNKALYNYRTSIYVPAMDHVFYSNTSAGNFTESENVYLGPGQHRIRFDYKGSYTGEVVSSTGTASIIPGYVQYEDMIWWTFV